MTDGITGERDLRNLRPLWAATPRISVPVSEQPSRSDYDIVIVGAGISGSIMARLLAKANRKILLVDRRAPARGSTMASTAMIQHEIDVPLRDLSGAIGQAKAQRVWRRSAVAVADLVALARTFEIECAMQEKQTLFLAGDQMGQRALREECELRMEAGLDAAYLDGAAVREEHGIDRTAAIRSAPSASCNPPQLSAGLLNSIDSDRVEMAAPLEITDLHETGREVILATSAGKLIRAGRVIFCTGYEFLHRMESPSHSIISTWAIASAPRMAWPQWLDDFLVWEASDPYIYFRSTPDGRIIAGGEDEEAEGPIQDRKKAARKFRTIARKVADILRIEPFRPAYGWSALFGTTKDGLPIIDRAPGHDLVHGVMGFGGNGLTFSMIAGQLIKAEVDGKPDPDAGLFAFR